MLRNGKAKTLALGLIISAGAAQAAIKKVTLFVNYGGPLHPPAIVPFVNTMNALKAEKGFELTISEQTNTEAQRTAAIANLKSQDVVLFANVGNSSFKNANDQAALQDFFTSGGKGIGFHATIDHGFYWKWWTDLHNGSNFAGHGNNPFKLTTDPEMKKIPAMQRMWEAAGLGEPNIASTEIYTLNLYPRGKEGVTMMQTVAAPNNAVPVHDFTWHKKIGNGQYIFTCLGHGPGDFTGGWMQKAIWAWMEYLNGKYDEATYVNGKPRLDDNTMSFDGATLDMDFGREYSMRVTDMRGKTVMSDAARGYRSYSLAGLRSGLFFVRVEGASGSHSRRLLIP